MVKTESQNSKLKSEIAFMTTLLKAKADETARAEAINGKFKSEITYLVKLLGGQEGDVEMASQPVAAKTPQGNHQKLK